MSIEFSDDIPSVKKTETKKLKKAKRPKRTDTEGCYVTNAQLLPAIMRAKEQGKLTAELAEMYQQIARRYLSSKNFSHLTFKEDLISAAVLALCANRIKIQS